MESTSCSWRAFVLFAFLCGMLHYPLSAQTEDFFFPQIGDGVSGGIRFQTTLVLASLGEGGSVNVRFFHSDGTPMSIAFEGREPAHELDIHLQRGESVYLQSTGEGEAKVGFARVQAEHAVEGTAIFRGSTPADGELLFEAAVPSTKTLSKFTVFVDTVENTDTGLALVNPGETIAQLSLKLFDSQFTLLATRTLRLEAGTHLARFISELFDEASEMRGVLIVESNQPISAVTLRFNGDGPTLTTFPVMAGTAEISDSASFFYSFENSLQGWVPDATDLELAGGEIDWSIQPTDEFAFHGDYSLRFFLENLNDAGKIWVRRAFAVKPSTTYQVDVRYQFGTGDSDINAFTIITGVSTKPPETRDDLQFQGTTSNGTGEPGFMWLEKQYAFTVESSPDGLLWVTVGIWGTWETPRTYLVDSLSVTFTEQ